MWLRVQPVATLLLFLLVCVHVNAERPAADEDVDRASGNCVYLAAGASHRGSGLTEEGERQVDDRLSLILGDSNKDMLQVMQKAAVWIAPTRAAMGTAIIALIRLYTLVDDRETLRGGMMNQFDDSLLSFLPKLEVKAGLRDGVGVRFEQLTEGSDLEDYLKDVARRWGVGKHLEHDEKFVTDKIIEELKYSYGRLLRQAGNPVAAQQESSKGALEMYDSVRRAKLPLATATEGQPVLMIGSLELAAYMFMPHLTSRRTVQAADLLQNMVREVQLLSPGAGLLAKWNKGSPGSMPYFSDLVDYTPGNEALPILAGVKKVPFDDMKSCGKEVEAAKVLPDRSQWWVGIMDKSKKRKKWFGYHSPQTRLMYVAWQPERTPQPGRPPNAGYVMWLTPDASQRKGIENIMDVSVQLVGDTTPRVEMLGRGGKWILDGGAAANREFVQAVQKAQNRVNQQ
mmetsp:Transcript_1670/g.3646  ORF Transcript_1670/g.3646 Transcript_1670/m.3646 type:complete len:455 (+) Transcript_1670:66-1430(+)